MHEMTVITIPHRAWSLCTVNQSMFDVDFVTVMVIEETCWNRSGVA